MNPLYSLDISEAQFVSKLVSAGYKKQVVRRLASEIFTTNGFTRKPLPITFTYDVLISSVAKITSEEVEAIVQKILAIAAEAPKEREVTYKIEVRHEGNTSNIETALQQRGISHPGFIRALCQALSKSMPPLTQQTIKEIPRFYVDIYFKTKSEEEKTALTDKAAEALISLAGKSLV